MKRLIGGISLVVAVLALASFIAGQAQKTAAPGQADAGSGAPPLSNPLKVALLKWYPANLTTAFKVGQNPQGITFDGANIWVSNNGEGTVTKLRANDGANLGTFPVGNAPVGVVFDGANIWVVNSRPNTVTKLRASDGRNLGEFPVGQVPYYAAFDGEAIWVANEQGASVTKLRASDGKLLGTFTDTAGPIDIICDGAYMWVSNFDGTLTRFKLDGTPAGTVKLSSGGLNALAFDGANIWAPDGGTLFKLRARDGAVLGNFSDGCDGSGVAFDGADLWCTAGVGYMVEVRPSDGDVLLTKSLPSSLQSVAFDGANIWVAGWGANRAFKL